MSDKPDTAVSSEGDRPARTLSPEAQRALAEATERQARAAVDAAKMAETGGPAGAEPTRFGDWERKGIAVDF